MLGTLAVTPGYNCTGMFTTHLLGGSLSLQFLSGDTRIQGPSVFVSSPGTQGYKVLLITFPPRGHKDTRSFCLYFLPGDTKIQGASVYVSSPGTQTVLGTLAVTSRFRNVGVTLHIHATSVNFTVLCSALLYSTVFYFVIQTHFTRPYHSVHYTSLHSTTQCTSLYCDILYG